VEGNDSLWETGKTSSENKEEIEEETDTLDLSEPSPEKERPDEEINLNQKVEEKDTTEDDNWAIPLAEDKEGIDIKTVGAIGTVVILILTGALFILLSEPNIEVTVPYEKYGSKVTYDIEGKIDFESDLDIPIPIGFINNDIVINELDVSFSGELKAEIKAPSEQKKDGYGELRNVFNKSIVQDLSDIDGSIKEEGENPAKLENAKVKTLQYQYIDDTSLEIIRSDIQSNASYSDTLTGKRWYWQSATDWVPRMSETGILPHGEAYIGKTLKQGNTGTVSEGGIEFNWKVDNGGKIDDKQTALLQIYTSYISDSLLGYQYEYQYNFDMYFTEESSFPIKFEMNFASEANSPGGKLYVISLQYKANANSLSEGYTDVPSTSYKTNSNTKTGEFEKWNNGAPAFGNGSCGLDSNFTIQDGIQKGKEDISKFNNYIDDQEGKGKPAFVTEANYTKIKGTDDTWNFTMAYRNPQSDSIKGWELSYNRTNVSGENVTLGNPIMSMSDIEKPLTVCSAERVMTEFDEIASWAKDKQTDSVDYTETKLLLGQNLVSQQSLSSPTSVIDIGNLNPINIVSDLSEGSLNFNDYSNNIDVESAGSYAYFLDRNGGSEQLGHNYQELAGVDAKDGLVLFNLQSRNSL
tara:strand:+ start:274 stop:2181 length:1908 start_codon:yes stop_codon:yes gene_type:complete